MCRGSLRSREFGRWLVSNLTTVENASASVPCEAPATNRCPGLVASGSQAESGRRPFHLGRSARFGGKLAEGGPAPARILRIREMLRDVLERGSGIPKSLTVAIVPTAAQDDSDPQDFSHEPTQDEE